MIRYFTVAFCLFFVGAALAFDEPRDFRGIPWEVSSDEAERLIRQQWTSRRADGELVLDTEITKRHWDERVKYFFFRDKLASLPVNFGLSFLDDKFVHAEIFFKSKDFPLIESAFKEKYGSPTTENSIPLQTGFGVRYNGKELRWNGPSMRIWLRQYDGKITDGTASLRKLIFLEYLAQKDKLKKKDAAKDL